MSSKSKETEYVCEDKILYGYQNTDNWVNIGRKGAHIQSYF